MRRLRRPTLSPRTQQTLQRQTQKILAAPDPKAEAERLWAQKAPAAFQEVREKLRTMTAAGEGEGFCAYCERNEPSDIEHFYPQASYPQRAFDWDNYLWACSGCNSNHKRDRFPLDAAGEPLLIDPSQEEPREHLGFSPLSGKLTPLSRKGQESIDVFGLNRGFLERSRHRAWRHLLLALHHYGESKQPLWAGLARRLVVESQHASLLLIVLELVDIDSPMLHLDPMLKRAAEVIHEHPEIRGWLVS